MLPTACGDIVEPEGNLTGFRGVPSDRIWLIVHDVVYPELPRFSPTLLQIH
jgi:hypothetical protein